MTTPRPGSRLGPYEIVAPLAAGGMGEVFRALDTRLGREVAIKVLTADLAGDRERLRRFELEARAASALNHPNLLTVHDVGTVDGHPYLVCELLEGVTLAQRLVEGPLGVRQALDYAAQIARGLAAAHDKGILHRDLKPANIFITRDDRVKILDFGLAKFQTPLAGAAIDQTPATMPGMVLGTAQYMSPEQVRGEALDHRSDIFSLGSMLFEMLAGRRAFGGESAPSLVEALHAILRDDPFEGPPLHLPPTLEGLLRHCLDKNPELRFQSTRDLAYTLEALAGSGGVTAPGGGIAASGRQGWSGWRGAGRGRRAPGGGTAKAVVAAAIAGVALGVGAGWFLWRALVAAPEPPMVRTLSYSGSERRPAFSPDGRTIAFVSARDGRPRVWLKELARGTEAPLTDGPDLDPRFSPDGAMVLFARHDGRHPALYRMSVVGGQARRVLDDAEQADFSPDGSQFAFLRTAEGDAGSVSVLGAAAADGSGARELRRFGDAFWANPRWSRDGRWIAVSRGGSGVRGAVALVAVDGGGLQPFELGSEGRVVGLAWTTDGQLLIAQSETLSAGVRSAPGALRLCRPGGACRSLLSVPNLGQGLDISSSGTAVYSSESTGQSLREEFLTATTAGAGAAAPPAMDPDAAPTSLWLTHGSSSDRQPVYSPDGRWLTFSSDRSGNLDLWSLERSTGALRRLTDHAGEDWDPAYTPGGRSLLWSSNRSGSFEIWMADADGGEPRQVTRDGGDSQNPTATADGQWIVYVAFAQDKRGLWRVRPDGSDARRLVANDLRHPEVSPDGRMVAYHYLEPALGELIRVVRVEDGATVPFSIRLAPGPGVGRSRWLPDGLGLAFVALDERGFLGVFRQDFTPGRDSAESRRPLGGFDADAATESFALAPGGDRLAISVERIQSFLQMASRLPGIEPAR